MAQPRDVGFGKDGFQRMKVYTEAESVARYILEILLTRPGNYPGLPHIGLNVRQYLYHNLTELNPDDLKEQIYTQCSGLMPNIISDDLYVGTVEYNGYTFLLIRVIAQVDPTTKKTINYAFYQNELKQMKFNFEIEE
jgi:hypothetical protein